MDQNEDSGSFIISIYTELISSSISSDAWRVNCWRVKEPESPCPEECDELNLGAPYLSELKPRTVLIHLKSVITHLSRVRREIDVCVDVSIMMINNPMTSIGGESTVVF